MSHGLTSEEGTTSKLRLVLVSTIGIVLIIMSISFDYIAQSNVSYPGYSLYNWNPSLIERIPSYKIPINSAWRAGVSKNASAGETLCAYLQSKPYEPELIFYNRMPKAGSGTMESLYGILSKKKKFGLWKAPKQFGGV